MESFLAKVRFWPKTMDYNFITHGLITGSPKKVWRKVYHLVTNEERNLMALVSVA